MKYYPLISSHSTSNRKMYIGILLRTYEYVEQCMRVLQPSTLKWANEFPVWVVMFRFTSKNQPINYRNGQFSYSEQYGSWGRSLLQNDLLVLIISTLHMHIYSNDGMHHYIYRLCVGLKLSVYAQYQFIFFFLFI